MQKIVYTTAFLSKLEDFISEAGYVLRYEKGNFRSGYCILKNHFVVVINKFLTLEGRINTLLDLIRELKVERNLLSDKSKHLYDKLTESQQPLLDFKTDGNQ
jgi:hypothetical protein